MEKNIVLIVLAAFSLPVASQNVELQAPLLAGNKAKLFYFTGARTDSVISLVDSSGKVSFSIPSETYKGMAALVIPNAGGVELVVGEPSVTVECRDAVLDNQTVIFPQSEENRFLKYLFTTQSRYLQQQAWLMAYPQVFPGDSGLLSDIQIRQKKVEDFMKSLDEEANASKLYAARYYRLAGFLNRLFDAEQGRRESGNIINEMETSLDIAALYTSGRIWESGLNLYLSMFNRMDKGDKQQLYAASVLRVIQRLSDPGFEAFISGCIVETQRFGWRLAQDSILAGLLSKYPGFKASLPSLQRAIGAYHAQTDRQMPAISGLDDTEEPYDKILIAFYDSDCSACVNEMYHLSALFPELKQKGIRVVSIAADTDRTRYDFGSKFPWRDKLCDFNGFNGVNYSNYNVVGTPSFFLTGKEGKLLGMYFSISDMEKGL